MSMQCLSYQNMATFLEILCNTCAEKSPASPSSFLPVHLKVQLKAFFMFDSAIKQQKGKQTPKERYSTPRILLCKLRRETLLPKKLMQRWMQRSDYSAESVSVRKYSTAFMTE